jgi:pilus assembly protein CpaC
MAVSGQSAKFSVGGETPYASAQPSTGLANANNNLSVIFKKWGIDLSFVPTLIGEVIHLKLDTQISNHDKVNGQQINGVNIPEITSKSVKTSVALGNGESLMIAGLLYNKTDGSTESKQFGLENIPILGALFRTNNVSDEQKELVIIVTPYVVEPVSSAKKLTLPTARVKFFNTIDQIITGKLAKIANADHSMVPSQLMGQAGFYY